MRKLIAAINMTFDGIGDHTAGLPDDDIHEYYSELLKNAGAILYGRKTYELMKFWEGVVQNPTGKQALDEFAIIIENVPKIVFSNTMKHPGWKNARLAEHDLKTEVSELLKQPGKDIYAGSPGLINSLLKLDLLDELQVCVYPVIAGSGTPLFNNLKSRKVLKLMYTKTFSSGAVIFYYIPLKTES